MSKNHQETIQKELPPKDKTRFLRFWNCIWEERAWLFSLIVTVFAILIAIVTANNWKKENLANKRAETAQKAIAEIQAVNNIIFKNLNTMLKATYEEELTYYSLFRHENYLEEIALSDDLTPFTEYLCSSMSENSINLPNDLESHIILPELYLSSYLFDEELNQKISEYRDRILSLSDHCLYITSLNEFLYDSYKEFLIFNFKYPYELRVVRDIAPRTYEGLKKLTYDINYSRLQPLFYPDDNDSECIGFVEALKSESDFLKPLKQQRSIENTFYIDDFHSIQNCFSVKSAKNIKSRYDFERRNFAIYKGAETYSSMINEITYETKSDYISISEIEDDRTLIEPDIDRQLDLDQRYITFFIPETGLPESYADYSNYLDIYISKDNIKKYSSFYYKYKHLTCLYREDFFYKLQNGIFVSTGTMLPIVNLSYPMTGLKVNYCSPDDDYDHIFHISMKKNELFQFIDDFSHVSDSLPRNFSQSYQKHLNFLTNHIEISYKKTRYGVNQISTYLQGSQEIEKELLKHATLQQN